MKPRFLVRARQEIADPSTYYASENLQLRDDLEHEIERALAHLCAFPLAGKPIEASYRSYKLRRFPYCLIYWPESDEIVITAFAHTARQPGYWR